MNQDDHSPAQLIEASLAGDKAATSLLRKLPLGDPDREAWQQRYFSRAVALRELYQGQIAGAVRKVIRNNPALVEEVVQHFWMLFFRDGWHLDLAPGCEAAWLTRRARHRAISACPKILTEPVTDLSIPPPEPGEWHSPLWARLERLVLNGAMDARWVLLLLLAAARIAGPSSLANQGVRLSWGELCNRLQAPDSGVPVRVEEALRRALSLHPGLQATLEDALTCETQRPARAMQYRIEQARLQLRLPGDPRSFSLLERVAAAIEERMKKELRKEMEYLLARRAGASPRLLLWAWQRHAVAGTGSDWSTLRVAEELRARVQPCVSDLDLGGLADLAGPPPHPALREVEAALPSRGLQTEQDSFRKWLDAKPQGTEADRG